MQTRSENAKIRAKMAKKGPKIRDFNQSVSQELKENANFLRKNVVDFFGGEEKTGLF